MSRRTLDGESGFSLMEAIVATLVAVIAVVGLAHTFGMGRGFIERFAIGRNALAVAQARIEALGVLQPASSAPELAIGVHPAVPFTYLGHPVGLEQWRVQWYDDPVTASTLDLKKITVVVTWIQGVDQDSVVLTRLIVP